MIDFAKLRQLRKDEENNFYILVSGDREFNKATSIFLAQEDVVVGIMAQDIVDKFLDKLLVNKVNTDKNIILISGDNTGVDELAAQYATNKQYQYDRIDTDWDAYGKRAGFQHNEDMISAISKKPDKACVLFWDGSNGYTKNLIYLCWMYGINVRVYHYLQKLWLSPRYIETIGMEEKEKAESYRRSAKRKEATNG